MIGKSCTKQLLSFLLFLQRKCVEYVLQVKPTYRFVPRVRFQYHIWRVVTSRLFEYMIFGFIVGNTVVLAAQVSFSSLLFFKCFLNIGQ